MTSTSTECEMLKKLLQAEDKCNIRNLDLKINEELCKW